MKARLPRPGDRFPDVELVDHEHRTRTISSFFEPPLFDRHLGFDQGYPLIVVFIRGPFCPRDQAQLRTLVARQEEFEHSGCSIVTVGVQPPEVLAAFRSGLGARWTFLSDPERRLIGALDLVDETEGEAARVSRPMTFVLDERRAVHSVYDGWWSVGRPTVDELRRDVRDVMAATKRAPYAAWTTARVTSVRIPQQRWLEPAGTEPEGTGRVAWFDRASGIGTIAPDESGGADVFFHFTAIPGEGYRTIEPGQRVRFDRSVLPTGPVASRVVIDATPTASARREADR